MGHLASENREYFIPAWNLSSFISDGIVFLYRFVSGSCPKSFGMEVAKMAGIPRNIIATATEEANRLEVPNTGE